MQVSLKFAGQKLLSGLYEPEGIYLHTPFEGEAVIAQAWGEHADFYGQWQYNGVTLKGHPGVDFALRPGARVLAVDAGRVIEISLERGGHERYIKIEHRWGESFYAFLGEIPVDAGQMVGRAAHIAFTQTFPIAPLHFAIRIQPYNRFDGWGGFSDPLPFMEALGLAAAETDPDDARTSPHVMATERPNMRRP